MQDGKHCLLAVVYASCYTQEASASGKKEDSGNITLKFWIKVLGKSRRHPELCQNASCQKLARLLWRACHHGDGVVFGRGFILMPFRP